MKTVQLTESEIQFLVDVLNLAFEAVQDSGLELPETGDDDLDSYRMVGELERRLKAAK